MRYSCGHGLSPFETQYRFANLNYIEFSEDFYEKALGYLGVSYNADALSEKEARSYNVLWSDKVKGKVGHFDWHLPNLGCLSLKDGNRQPGPYELREEQWQKLQETTLSLKPQVRGFYDYGGTLSSLRNGDVAAMCGIGDWITGLLQRDGARVATVVPEEGGIQWSESFCIGKDTQKYDLAKQFIQYITSPEGQVKSAMMQAYPALIPTQGGWKKLNEAFPEEAKRQGMVLGERSVLDDYREGRIHFRQWPVNQSLEDWNDFWTEYKNA
jgi:spermidine/putrescine transport system substrate-binding protein